MDSDEVWAAAPASKKMLPEVIDVDTDESSSIKPKAYAKVTSNDEEYYSTTETEDESEMEKIRSSRVAREQDKKTKRKPSPVNEIPKWFTNTVEDKKGEKKSNHKRRRCVKLEDVKKIDILFPNEKDCCGVREAKTDFYEGYIWYRKVIDEARRNFMGCESITEKLRICQLVIGKAQERGVRFLREIEDGKSGICIVMPTITILKSTLDAFEDKKSWTMMTSFLKGKRADTTVVDRRSQESKLKVSNPPPLPQLSISSNRISESISSLKQDFLAKPKDSFSANVTAQHSNEPPAKKMRIGVDASTAVLPSSLTRAVTGTSESHKASTGSQNCLVERKMIWEELAENQKKLVMQQDIIACLEVGLRKFQNQQVFRHAEQWLTENIARQEEILKNRELLGIQQQRCRGLQNLLEINERQMVEHRSIIENKLQAETLQSKSKLEYPLALGFPENLSNKTTIAQYAHRINAIENENNKPNDDTAEVEARKRKLQLKLTTRQLIDQQLALELEINRQSVLEQHRAKEQEIEYRLEMNHAAQRKSAMQRAIQARRVMMARADLLHRSPEIPIQETPKSTAGLKSDSLNVAESMGNIYNAQKGKNKCEKETMIATKKWEVAEGDVEELDDDDDDASIVI